MKKKLFLTIILALEFVMYLVFALGKVYPNIQGVVPFNFVCFLGQWFYDLNKTIMSGIHLDSLFNSMLGGEYVHLNVIFSTILFNIVFIILYYVIFGVLTIVFAKHREKKIRKLVAPYELSSNEYDKFNYKHYLSRFPIKRTLSLIIPILFILMFTFIRFDATICLEASSKLSGTLNISKDFIEPLFNVILTPIDFHVFISNIMKAYIGTMNSLLGNFAWIEYGFIGIGYILILGIWFGFFTLLHLIFKKPYAKRKANKARKHYIHKMEYIEYKLRIKYKDETSIKADDFMHIVETEQKEAAKEIARFKSGVTDEEKDAKEIEQKKKAYYEEIGQGVTDLGISEEKVDLDSPIVERQAKYISDEEVDIILDEEPVIEIVENEQEETNIEFGRNAVFFERYQPDDIEIKTVEEYSGNSYRDEDKVSEHEEPQVVEEEIEETQPNEEIKEEVIVEEEPTIIKEEITEEKVEEKVTSLEEEEIKPEIDESIEEIKQEEKVEETIVEENIIQEKIDPQEAKQDEVLTIEVEEVKEEVPVSVEEIKEEPIIKDDIVEEVETAPIKFDPFAKWRGRKNEPGYGAKKVPSFKELKAQQEKKDQN